MPNPEKPKAAKEAITTNREELEKAFKEETPEEREKRLELFKILKTAPTYIQAQIPRGATYRGYTEAADGPSALEPIREWQLNEYKEGWEKLPGMRSLPRAELLIQTGTLRDERERPTDQNYLIAQYHIDKTKAKFEDKRDSRNLLKFVLSKKKSEEVFSVLKESPHSFKELLEVVDSELSDICSPKEYSESLFRKEIEKGRFSEEKIEVKKESVEDPNVERELKEVEEKPKKSEQELKEVREKLEEISKRGEEEELEKGKIDEEKTKLETIKELVGETIPKMFKDLVGDDSEKAWKKRRKWESKKPMYVAASLAGVASKRSQEWLDKHKEDQKLWWGISQGLIGDNSEKAWEIRDWLKFDQKAKRVRGKRWTSLKKSLGLHKSERLFNLRKKIKFPGWYEPGDMVISTTGLDSEKSRQLREEFEDIAPAEALISLAGNNSEGAQKIRKKYEKDKRLRWAYEKSLTGVEV